jgi:hypothetical protein
MMQSSFLSLGPKAKQETEIIEAFLPPFVSRLPDSNVKSQLKWSI